MRVRSRACAIVAAVVVGGVAAGPDRAGALDLFAPFSLLKAAPIVPAPPPAVTAVDLVGPFSDRAPLWRSFDPLLQRNLQIALDQLGLLPATQRLSLDVALVDITDVAKPRVAAINGDHMMYAASLPKIAILLGAFERIAAGQLSLDQQTESLLKAMIRVSSNKAASLMMEKVGLPFIADVLSSPRYRLYDEFHNGGLWAGKAYAQAGLWQRDPLHNLSHGGTPMQIARFYYLLETGQLVSPEHSLQMKRILGSPGINHKFVKGMKVVDPTAQLFRKSGSWANWHSDSAIVERAGRRYIAVALCDDPRGRVWLEDVIRAFDAVIFGTPVIQRAAVPAVSTLALVVPPASEVVRKGPAVELGDSAPR
jgi:beta-lactamase class A